MLQKILLILLIIFTQSIFADEITIAVRAHSGEEKALKEWMPTIDYLQGKITQHKLTLLPVKGIKEMEVLFSTNQIDFVITQPIAYVDLEHLYGATRMLTLVKSGGFTQFGSVIFSKKDSQIHDVQDIKGKTIAGVTKKGFGGWLIGYSELLNFEIDAYRDTKKVIFSGTHEGVVKDVLSGHVNVGIVRTGIIERMIKQGQLTPDVFQIINQKDTESFTQLHSTTLYPEWAFAKAKHASPIIAADIVTYLLALKPDSSAAVSAHYHGWSIPLDYNPVHKLMQKLQVGSYSNYGEFNLVQFLRKNSELAFFILFFLLILILLIAIYIHQKNKRLLNLTQSLKDTQQTLELSEERIFTTLKSIGDAVISTDLDSNITYINPIAESLTGWSNTEAMGQPLSSIFKIINEGTRLTVQNPVEKCLEEGRIVGLANHTILMTQDGKETAIEDSAAPIKNHDGDITGVVLVFHDVTEARRLSSELNYQAIHDSLTDLINRREFERRLHNALKTAIERDITHSILYIDLDQFKVINDTSGHVAGDELLRQIVVIIKQTLRDGDTLARLGGDEFGVLLENCPLEKGGSIGQLICDSVSEFRFVWEDKTFRIGASIGAVSIDENSETLAKIMSEADIACYKAKEQGRNCVYSAAEHSDELTTHHSELLWLPKLRKALSDNSFKLYYQKIEPTVALGNNCTHIEFLIRLSDKNEIIPPNVFIPIAERFKLMPDIDLWIIEHIFAYIHRKQINAPSENNLFCINLSGDTVSDHRLIGFILKQQEKYQINPASVCFEVTETAAIANLSTASVLIKILKDKGFSFSLDDFGSGMSSFAYLKNLPVDYLKIDGMFVKDIINDPIDLAMVQSINDIGHAMGLKTIAEYIESQSILDKITEIGVDYAQGYHIHKPEVLVLDYH